MKLFPAIDIFNGRCVRLLKGDFNKVTDYGAPIDIAKAYQSQGAEFLHIVDLNAAKGEGDNFKIILQIADCLNIPIQTGGGVRDTEQAKKRLDSGIYRVILGSVCLKDSALVEQLIKEYGADRIACGVDCKDGYVSTHGWLQNSSISGIELIEKLKGLGVKIIIYTDISRDGTLKGIDSKFYGKLSKDTQLNIIASGGISTLEDIKNLKSNEVYGAILGKALLEKCFGLADALKI